MPAFTNYRTCLKRMRDTPLFYHRAKREGLDYDVLAARIMLAQDPSMKSLATQAMVEEWIWTRKGRPTLFVDSQTLPGQVLRLPVSGGISQILPRWGGYTAFVFRTGARAGKLDLCPVLFGYVTAQARHPMVEQAVQEILGAPFKCEWATRPQDLLTMTINTHPYTQRLVIPVSDLDAIMEHPVEWLDQHRLMDTFWSVENSDKDRGMQAVHLRTILGLIVYAQAFPGALRGGLPDSCPPRNLGPGAKEHQGQARTMKGFSTHERPGDPFLRSAHFRVLGHERFEHYPDGSPRVIPVRAAVVGGKIDAETMEVKP